MPDQNSALLALVTSNITERDRAKDVEQLEDILRMFIKETNQFEKCSARSEMRKRMHVVKKLMFMNLLNFTLRGTTLKYKQILIALGNIIDKGSTAPTIRQKKVDTSALLEIGVAAKNDSESSRKEETRESWTSHCKPFQRDRQRQVGAPEVQAGSFRDKCGKDAIRRKEFMAGKATARMEAKEQRKVQGRQHYLPDTCQSRAHCSLVSKRRQQELVCHCLRRKSE